MRQAEQVSDSRERVAREQERAAAVAGEWSQVIDALRVRATVMEERWPAGRPDGGDESDDSTPRRHLLSLRRRESQIASALGDVEAAWLAINSAHQWCPNDPLLLMDMAALAEQQPGL